MNKDVKGAGHRGRIRNLVGKAGLKALTQQQIIEFLLFFGIPFKDTKTVASSLFSRFGNMRKICDADIESLMEIKGMTRSAASLLRTVPAIAEIYGSVNKLPDRVFKAENILPFLITTFGEQTTEFFCLISINEKNKIVHNDIFTVGSVDNLDIVAKDLVETAKIHDSKKVLVAHNHPSNDVSPSEADIENTAKMREMFRGIGVEFLDHLILGKDSAYSFDLQAALTYNPEEILYRYYRSDDDAPADLLKRSLSRYEKRGDEGLVGGDGE